MHFPKELPILIAEEENIRLVHEMMAKEQSTHIATPNTTQTAKGAHVFPNIRCSPKTDQSLRTCFDVKYISLANVSDE
jgi:hypothetical protein